MEKRQVSERVFFNKVVEANAIIAEDGLTQTIYGYFAIVNVPNDEAKLETFMKNVYGTEAESIAPPKSGWYLVVKDIKTGEDSYVLKGHADEIEWSFHERQEDYKKALARKAKIEAWKTEESVLSA